MKPPVMFLMTVGRKPLVIHGKAQDISLPVTLCGSWISGEHAEITEGIKQELLDSGEARRCKRCLPDVSGFAARNEYA